MSFDAPAKVLMLAALSEIAAGGALMIAPGMLVLVLLGIERSSMSEALGRFVGIALLALGIACWPARGRAQGASAAYRAMLIYNPLVALYLACLGAIAHVGGVLLWPVVALHVLITLLLVAVRRRTL
ncbi:hypothetical protein WKW80_06050 [Variovorax humicola]|uniref:Transmembrane protein n=1 Tax=Variovorax humicola TaxID=1769758 RepID=A0ABU8VV69_9BURK